MTTYEEARAELLEAEVALMQQRERVAEMRRQLPDGPEHDHELVGPDGPVRLGELVGERPLVLYHFMFGKAQTSPCPMCSMWADGWNGVADHLAENVDFALVTAASVADNRRLVADKGWDRLRVLSAGDSTFKQDIGGEDADGNQMPYLSVWEQGTGGRARLTYSGGAHLRGDLWRGVDLLSPVWHVLDLTRPGRGDWMPGGH